MTGVVIDASTALAWCFPDDPNEYADSVLVALEGKAVLVPAMWSPEIANAVLVGQRKKRLRQPETPRLNNSSAITSATSSRWRRWKAGCTRRPGKRAQ